VKVGASTDPLSYAAKDTQVWSFADPEHPVKIGTLPNISQASVTYNSGEGKWVVTGNAATADPSGKVTGLGSRTIWTATDSAGNSSWMNGIGHGGSTVPGGGTRENQYADQSGAHVFHAMSECLGTKGSTFSTPARKCRWVRPRVEYFPVR